MRICQFPNRCTAIARKPGRLSRGRASPSLRGSAQNRPICGEIASAGSWVSVPVILVAWASRPCEIKTRQDAHATKRLLARRCCFSQNRPASLADRGRPFAGRIAAYATTRNRSQTRCRPGTHTPRHDSSQNIAGVNRTSRLGGACGASCIAQFRCRADKMHDPALRHVPDFPSGAVSGPTEIDFLEIHEIVLIEPAVCNTGILARAMGETPVLHRGKPSADHHACAGDPIDLHGLLRHGWGDHFDASSLLTTPRRMPRSNSLRIE